MIYATVNGGAIQNEMLLGAKSLKGSESVNIKIKNMKKLITFTIVLFYLNSVFAQTAETKKLIASIDGQWKLDESGIVSYQRIVELPQMKKDEIYKNALSYFVYNYGSGKSVIQTQDKDLGIIIGKGLYINVYSKSSFGSSASLNAWHIVKIEAKDGKARISISITDYELNSTVANIGSSGTISNNRTNTLIPIAAHYPVIIKEKLNVYEKRYEDLTGNCFYGSHLKVLASLDQIEKALKDENSKIKSDNW